MSNLLDQASIVLTPTAYNNGEALCIKPDDGSGDFDFSRNSAATRVNAQGLVENVQILSSNLVQNGDFSELGAEEVSNGSFSQEGAEEIVNGSFDTDSDWGLGNGWSIEGGEAVALNSASGQRLRQDNILQVGKIYKLTYEVKSISSGGFRAFVGGVALQQIYNIGVYTETMTTPTINDDFFIRTLGTTSGSIDNVSVREVGQDWDLSSSNISIGEDKLVCNNVLENNAIATQVNVIPVQKQVKVQFHIVVNSGSFRMLVGSGGTSTIVTTSGTYTFYETSGTGGNLNLQARAGGFDGSITNISVKEVGQNWDLGTGWSIGNNVAISDATQGYIVQTDVGGAGVTANYKIQWVQNITAGTRLRFFARNYNDGGNATILSITRDDGLIIGGGNCIGSGTFTAYVSSTNGYSFKLLAEAGVEGDISNVTTIQITDDTNLPRINYEGFSYQDALGSELVVNGTFDDGENNWDFSGDWTLVNGTAEILTSTNSFLVQSNVVDLSVKNYKLQYEVITTNGSNFRLAGGNSAFGTITLDSATVGVKTIYLTSNGTARNLQFNQNAFRGSIDNVSVKEYLGQEVVPDSGCGSWLFEPQTTQLLTYSEDFSQWIAGGDTTIESGYLAPDGTNNAYKVSGTSSTLALPAGLTATTTRSIYAKTVSGTGQANLCSFNQNTNNIFTITEEWQRFDVNSAIATGVTTFYAVDFRGGTTLNEIILWGANATNDQDYATSYIPSNGSSVTRNQDVCTNGGSLASINSTEGVLYAEIAALADDGTNRRISLSDDTNNNRVVIYYATSNDLLVLVRVANTTSFSYTFNTDTKQFLKIGLKWKQDDFALWVNGVKLAGDTSGNTFPENTLNDFSFTDGSGTTLPFFGKTKAIAVWKEALSDSELQELTTI